MKFPLRSNLLGLDLDGFGKTHGAARWIANLNSASVTHVSRNDCGLRPIQLPAVFDRQNRVGAGHYIAQTEGSIKIALIATEKVSVVLWIFRDEDDHRSGEGSTGALRGSLHVQTAAD